MNQGLEAVVDRKLIKNSAFQNYQSTQLAINMKKNYCGVALLPKSMELNQEATI